jgi:hypothetical protein
MLFQSVHIWAAVVRHSADLLKYEPHPQSPSYEVTKCISRMFCKYVAYWFDFFVHCILLALVRQLQIEVL